MTENGSSYLRPLSYITYYKSSVSVTSSQYHFISQEDYNRQNYQKISLKLGQQNNYRSMRMYLQKQSIKQIQNRYKQNTMNKKDNSQIKDFSYIDYLNNQQNNIFINNQKAVRQSIWAIKYQPKAFYQLLTDQAHNRNVLAWLKSWDPIVFNKQAPVHLPVPNNFFKQSNINQRQNYLLNQFNHNKLLLLSGPPGCGKTTLARVIARHCGYEVAQLNASDDRSAKNLITKIQALGKSNSITNNKPIMIVVDQVDGALQHDGNGIKQVLTYIQNGFVNNNNNNNKKQKHNKSIPNQHAKSQYPHKNNSQYPHKNNSQYPHKNNSQFNCIKQKQSAIPRPIIFICNDPFVKGLKQLRSKALVVYFKGLQKQRVVKRLRQITQIQKIYIQSQVLNKIVEISNNDIRSCLSVLQYVCKNKRQQNIQPKDLINKLKLSFTKDSNTSIMQFINKLLNQTKSSILKETVNLRQFQYSILQLDNHNLLFEIFVHNFILYKNFFIKKTKQSLKIYDQLRWVDQLMKTSFKYNNQLDSFIMMLFLYYRTRIVNEQIRKIQFPSLFFQRINKQKQQKSIIDDMVVKWPCFIRSNTPIRVIVKQYLYLLYYAIQPISNKDSDIIQSVGRMITYGIQLNHRNSNSLFKPEIDSLLTFNGQKLEILFSGMSRNMVQQTYEYAKLKAHLLSQISLMDLNHNDKKSTQDLMNQLNLKKKNRKRNPNQNINGIKYKFIQGSGTQITYDLKFKFFFQ